MIKLKPNIGILGSLIRITLGLTILSCSTAKMVRRPYRQCYLWLAVCGAMKVAEGIVRYCPATDLLQQADVSITFQNKNENSTSSNDDKSSEFNGTVPEN